MKKYLILIAAMAMLATGCNVNKKVTLDNKTANPTQAEMFEAPDMSQWQTYENSQLGFKISYPPSYQAQENPTDLPIPEDNPNQYKDVVLVLSNQGANEETYGLIYVRKTKASLKSEASKHFNWYLNSLTKVDEFWVFDYFTGSATDLSRVYLITDTSPRYPGDDGSVIGNILSAEIEASNTGEKIPAQTTPDWIARTLTFIK